MTDLISKEVPLDTVQVDALVVMKIIKACSSSFPTTATGSIVGMEQNGTLEVTNCFPLPTTDINFADPHSSEHQSPSNLALAAIRTKANYAYQKEMIRCLREVNVDANNVGWYSSADMGSFINASLIENQYHYQKEANERTIALIHDLNRSSHGSLCLQAFRLTPAFMNAYKEGKFTTEILQKSKLSYKDIIVEIPVVIHNSHLLTTFLHQIPVNLPESLELPGSVSELYSNPPPVPFYPKIDCLELSIDSYLEKTCDHVLESIETHTTELNNFQYFQRHLAREQAKITAWKAKRAAENSSRATQKLAPLPEDERERLFKVPTEPSRLESMLNARQMDQYSKQVDGFTAAITSKMFAVKSNLMPECI